MPYKDLHEFAKFLEENKDLHRVNAPVDRFLEIAEIADRMVKKRVRRFYSKMSRALIFRFL
jgi:3-octaprenyl-4hydroxybenzoate decarboxylase (EC 4.1.1.-)